MGCVHDYPTPRPSRVPICPVCGTDCGTVYLDLNSNVIGCDNCVLELDAEEWLMEEEDE